MNTQFSSIIVGTMLLCCAACVGPSDTGGDSAALESATELLIKAENSTEGSRLTPTRSSAVLTGYYPTSDDIDLVEGLAGTA